MRMMRALSPENKNVLLYGIGTILIVLWISALILNLDTQYMLGFEYWEAGAASMLVYSLFTLIPGVLFIYLAFRRRVCVRKKEENK
jgi:hypothetical protein